LRENFDRFNFAIHKEKEMADFRRWFLAFATLVLVIGSTVPANAQAVGPQIQCNVATSVSPQLRHEGLTELVGDILLECSPSPNSTGPTPVGSTIAQADIVVSLSALLSTSTIGPGLDALLLVDDPNASQQDVCGSPNNGLLCQVAGDGGKSFKTNTKYNTFQGILTGAGTITFLGVPIDPAATGLRTYRITNIRVQGSSVSVPAGGYSPVYAYVSASSSTSIQIVGGSVQTTVGEVTQGLTFSAGGTNPPFLQCQSYESTQVGAVTFAEGFPNAFKNQNAVGGQTAPGQVYYSESGLQVLLPSGETTGLANSPTEFQAVISNIPSGVQIWVDAWNENNVGMTASLVSPTVANSGQVLLVDNESGAPVSATAVWAVGISNASAFPASFTFNVYTSFAGAPGANGGSPQANVTAYAQGGFYPQEAGGWVNDGPVPEFVVGLLPAAPGASLFTVSLCQTILLFPYVTDFTGFDTGIAISNTSLDNLPVGASPQTGACTVAFYGDGGLSATVGSTGNTPGYVNSNVSYNGVAEINGTGLILPGQTWAFSLSNSDMGYESTPTYGTTGYAIATCDFQYAHGYSFVSDTGIRNFAAAYLALIIPDAPRSPNPFLCASGVGCAGQAGEQLVH
jgi:hypothetical protein